MSVLARILGLRSQEAVNTSLVPMIDAGTLLTAYGRSVFPSSTLAGVPPQNNHGSPTLCYQPSENWRDQKQYGGKDEAWSRSAGSNGARKTEEEVWDRIRVAENREQRPYLQHGPPSRGEFQVVCAEGITIRSREIVRTLPSLGNDMSIIRIYSITLEPGDSFRKDHYSLREGNYL